VCSTLFFVADAYSRLGSGLIVKASQKRWPHDAQVVMTDSDFGGREPQDFRVH